MRPIVEECHRLDVKPFVGDLDASEPRTIKVGDNFVISIVAETDDTVACLVRAVNDGVYSNAWPVNAVKLPREVGRRRWFLQCVGCARLVSYLLLPPGAVHLRCRRCHRARYFSQTITWTGVPALAERRARYGKRLRRARSAEVRERLRARLRKIDQQWQAKARRVLLDKLALVEEVVAQVDADEAAMTSMEIRKGPPGTRATGRVAGTADAHADAAHDEMEARVVAEVH